MAPATAAEYADSGENSSVCNLGRKVESLRCAHDAGDFHHDTGGAGREIASRRDDAGRKTMIEVSLLMAACLMLIAWPGER